MDQYKNPHESSHTIDEVLEWFNKTGFKFVNGLPKLRLLDSFSSKEQLFKSNSSSSRLRTSFGSIRNDF